jgi:hypothetical protein
LDKFRINSISAYRSDSKDIRQILKNQTLMINEGKILLANFYNKEDKKMQKSLTEITTSGKVSAENHWG